MINGKPPVIKTEKFSLYRNQTEEHRLDWTLVSAIPFSEKDCEFLQNRAGYIAAGYGFFDWRERASAAEETGFVATWSCSCSSE